MQKQFGLWEIKLPLKSIYLILSPLMHGPLCSLRLTHGLAGSGGVLGNSNCTQLSAENNTGHRSSNKF